MFNEELDLGEAQTEEREGVASRARRLSDGQVKQEVVDDLCGGHNRPPRGPVGEASGLLGKVSRSISRMKAPDRSIYHLVELISLTFDPFCLSGGGLCVGRSGSGSVRGCGSHGQQPTRWR